MKTLSKPKLKAKAEKPLTFQSRLERISDEADYFAISVPAKVSRTVGVKSAVPIFARVNGSPRFRGSLFPVGGGRHSMRVKAAIRAAAGIGEGDRVRVEISVADREKEASELPRDLAAALKAEGVRKDFDSLPVGKRSYMLRWISQAAKPETREKRIQTAIEAAHERREKMADKR